ncbi:MAG: Yip1 family protein, partial [Anaerolineales bacterium]
CYSGNLAQVYFDLEPRKLALSELNAAYPGMVDALVQHEGIGFVVAYEDDGEPVAFGKNGARNLHTDDVLGEDPLIPFGDVELRSWQVRRIADFPNAGDLILNSTLYPDGTVAALEELIGNHGGLGGEQTDAFILHPGDMVIPETRNSYEVRNILAARRGLPGPTPLPETQVAPVVNAWSLGNLAKGLGQVQTWLTLAAQSIALNRDAFREIASNTLMTAPAILIFIIGQIFLGLTSPDGFSATAILVRVVLWFVSVLAMMLGARLLRGTGTFTSTLRVSGFANSAYIFELLGFVPVVGPIAHFIAELLVFFGNWIGIATAHELRGWRTLILPVIYLLVLVVGVVFILSILRGTAFTIQSLLSSFGLTGQ